MEEARRNVEECMKHSHPRWGRMFLALLMTILPAVLPAPAYPETDQSLTLRRPIAFPYYPVVLRGKDLPFLLKRPIHQITIYRYQAGVLRPIPFQIDRRDSEGFFEIPSGEKERRKEGEFPFDRNDECVFMASDLGEKMERGRDDAPFPDLEEIRITDPKTGRSGWIYAGVATEHREDTQTRNYVSYDRKTDTVESDVYRIGYSKKTPFVIELLQWKGDSHNGPSANLLDTMKARHRGKFLHQFDFVRTERDSTSKLLGVRQGPVRVIRSTENRALLFLGLKTPGIHIDFIHYPNAVFMDIRIRIPFRIGLFFSNVETLMTMDGNSSVDPLQTRVYTPSVPQGALIDGKMSEAERRINASGDREVEMINSRGSILVGLKPVGDFPLHYQVHIEDDRAHPDPPENIPGEYGNVGFLTTGWEDLAGSSYRMIFSMYMTKGHSVEKGFEILQDAPHLPE
jgi:hypothetical protein